MGTSRREALWPVVAAVLVIGGPAVADTPPAAGSTSYPAAYFAPTGATTAFDMVLRLPGFSFDDGSAVRGFAGAAGNVLINGERPTSKTDDLMGVLQRIPISQVVRIDLIRGAAPGIDMQGKTVVANVILKSATGFSGIAGLADFLEPEGDDPLGRFDGTWRLGDGRSVEAGLSVTRFHDNTQGDGPHRITAADGRLLDSSDMRNSQPGWQNTLTGAYETPLLGGRLRANLLLQDLTYKLTNLDDFRVAGREQLTTGQDQKDAELGLHFERAVSGALSLEALALGHLNETAITSVFDTRTDDQAFNLRDKGGEGVARAVLHWQAGAGLTVEAGGEFAYNWLKTRTRFTDNGAPITVPAADVLVDEKRAEGFATATWLPLATLSVEAGMRIEASAIGSRGDVTLAKTLVFPKPRLVVTWSPDAADQLRFRIEREVGQLDFKSFAASAQLNGVGVVAGNPSLEPQQDWAIEAAYERRFWKDGVVSLTLRRLMISDAVDQVPVLGASGVFDAPGNIGAGVENDVVASFNLPLDRFGVSGGSIRGLGTWRFSEVTDPATGRRRPISDQHPRDAELHFVQDLPRWKLNWGVDAVFAFVDRSFRFDEIDTNTTGVFADVFVEYRPKPDLVFHLELDNVLAYDIERQVFAGPRGAAPLDFIDLQQHRFGPVLFARVRKTFG
ncbi:MAG TPA: TonB-dependent receptor [Caulobacteraceae bacterium]